MVNCEGAGSGTERPLVAGLQGFGRILRFKANLSQRHDAVSIMNAFSAFQENHAPGSPGAVPYNFFGNNGIPNSSFVRYLLTFAPNFGNVPHSARAEGRSNLVFGR